MKTQFGKFAVFFATFFTSICVLFFSYEPTIRKLSIEVDYIPTTVCQIQSSSYQYDGSALIIEATTDGLNPSSADHKRESDELPLYPLNCEPKGVTHHKALLLKFGNYIGANSDLKAVIETPEPWRKGDDTQAFKEVDVRVSGVIRKSLDKKGNEVFVLSPTKIEIISPFRRGFP